MDLKLLATVFGSVFIAELGDKTQLATLLFSADQAVSKLTVFIAASAALILATGIGVLAGGVVSQYISAATLKYVAGAGFIAIGAWTLLRRMKRGRRREGRGIPRAARAARRPSSSRTPGTSARRGMLEKLGFEALATTSAGFAFSIGVLDNRVGRERMLAHVAEIAAATDLPVSADLENGFGDDLKTVAETIRRASATGIVGGSIEDSHRQSPGGKGLRHRARHGPRPRRGRGQARPALSVHADGACGELPRRASRTSPTRSSACRPTRRPARMSSMHRASRRERKSRPSSSPWTGP